MILQLLHLFQTCETKNNYTLTPDVNKLRPTIVMVKVTLTSAFLNEVSNSFCLIVSHF